VTDRTSNDDKQWFCCGRAIGVCWMDPYKIIRLRMVIYMGKFLRPKQVITATVIKRSALLLAILPVLCLLPSCMPSDRADIGINIEHEDIIDWPRPGDGEEISAGQDDQQEAGQDTGMPGTAGDPENTAGKGELQEAEQGAAAPEIGDNAGNLSGQAGSQDAEQDTVVPETSDNAGNTGNQQEPQRTGKEGNIPETADDGQTPAEPEDPNETDQVSDDLNAVDRIRNALKDIDSPAVTDELVRLFFDYQGESHRYKGPKHRYELRLLPEFGPGKTLDWDGLTVFIFFMSNHLEHDQDEEGSVFFSRELFDETARRLLPGLKYKHRRSAYFYYENGVYKATGWDMHGGVYYRLKSISRDDKGTFTASFDGFVFHENDYFGAPYDMISENMKAMYDYVGGKRADTADEDEVLLEIFLRDDYDEILHVDQHLEITFRISSDPLFAFEYLSCTREYLGQ